MSYSWKISSIFVITLAFLLSRGSAFVIGGRNVISHVSRGESLDTQAGAFSNTVILTPKAAPTTTASTSLTQSTSSDNDVVVIDRDFRLAGIFLVGGLFLDQIPFLKVTLGPIVTLLGVLFLVQTFRLRFVCDNDSFSLPKSEDEESSAGENILVGGENKWSYDKFVNYEFFPKGWIDQPQGPILVYFKENQTPSDTWYDGPGAKANSDEALANGAIPGQVHFFPALCNTQQLKAEWERRGCQKL